MNHAIDLLHQAEAAGVRLEIEGGEIYAEGALNPAMIEQLRAHKAELLALLSRAELQESIREHFEERSAIREYDGHEPRQKAEAEAKNALRVYEYRLTDNPDNWLILLAPGCDLLEAERVLKNRFGPDRVVAVRAR